MPRRPRKALLQLAFQDECRRLGYDPIARLTALLHQGLEPALEVRIHLELLQYIYPKRRAVEVSGHDGGPLQIQLVSFADHSGP